MIDFAALPLRKLLLRALLTMMFVNLSGSQVFALQAAIPAISQASGNDDARILGRSWKLTSLYGRELGTEISKAPQVTLIKDGVRIVGFAGCNRFGATYSLQHERLSINSDLVVVPRTCATQMDLEREFLKAIRSTDSWKIAGETLEFLSKDQVVARFR